MGDRSMTPSRRERSTTPTPRGGAAGGSTDRTDNSTAFGDGHDTMDSIIEETLNLVPGIDDDPDDMTPWAANLTFPDLMDLARTIKRDLNDSGHEDKRRDGWKGPVGMGNSARTVLHNVRFWWRPHCHEQPLPFSCDRSLRTWLKTVLLFEPGSIRIMLRDAPMHAQVPPLQDLNLPQGEMRRFMVLARPALADAGFMDHRSTYKGERQPEGQGKKRQQREESRGAYKGDGAFVGIKVPSPRDEPIVLKQGPGVNATTNSVVLRQGPGATTATKSMPKPPKAEVEGPEFSTSLAQPVEAQEPSDWKEVRKRKARRPPPPPRPVALKPKERPRKRWADWSDSGSEGEAGVDGGGLVISSEDPNTRTQPVASLAVLSKARKRVVTRGITQLRDHDKALKNLLCVSNLGTTVGPKHIVVFTSEPGTFQDPITHCVDVGISAKGPWTPNGARKELQEVGPSLVVVAIRYNENDEGLKSLRSTRRGD